MNRDLFRAIRQGNRGAISRLLNGHRTDLRAIATEELSNGAESEYDAEKLVDRTLRAAEAEIAAFNGTCQREWLEWLRAILRRNLRDEAAGQRERMQVAMATLPMVQGQVVRLRQIKGWKLARIAVHLGLDEVTVAGLLRRGIRRLRNAIEPQGEGER